MNVSMDTDKDLDILISLKYIYPVKSRRYT
jgi:hypothetical protein